GLGGRARARVHESCTWGRGGRSAAGTSGRAVARLGAAERCATARADRRPIQSASRQSIRRPSRAAATHRPRPRRLVSRSPVRPALILVPGAAQRPSLAPRSEAERGEGGPRAGGGGGGRGPGARGGGGGGPLPGDAIPPPFGRGRPLCPLPGLARPALAPLSPP